MNALVTVLFLSILSWAFVRARNRRHRFPPGPRGLPLIGTINFPKKEPWKVYRDWAKEYESEVIYVNSLGNHLIILNSYESAIDLLDKRSSIYSDRPMKNITMLAELCGLGWLFAFLQYGQAWRDGRKAFQREFGPKVVGKYQPHQRWAAIKLLRRVLRGHDSIAEHINHMTGGLILSIAYGIEVQEENDPFIAAAETSIQVVTTTLVPGAYLVDLFPPLKYVPEWVPGAGFKRQARLWKEAVMFCLHKPWELVRTRMATRPDGTPDCAAKTLLEEMVIPAKDPAHMEEIVRGAVGSMYIAGSDTTNSNLQSFLLAMVLYPEAQCRAQDEIDQICRGRLPEFSDSDSLPYLHALLKETLRWYPVASINFAHRCSQDDSYRGYVIPKGSVVLVNNWAILHDPARYKDPETFSPERFLKPSEADATDVTLDPDVFDPELVAFGFGRRICPGRYMASDSLWITIACILTVFNIEKAVDEAGQPITPSGEAKPTFITAPKPFPCKITPRSDAHAALIRQAADQVPSFVNQ